MIGKINISKNPSFAHICAYVAKEEKHGEVLAAHGVRDTSAAAMAEDFDVQRALNPKLGRAVMHVALAWAPEEQAMSNERMVELARAWMREMKIDPDATQWSLTRHKDQQHPHAHLIINRVDNQGETISDKKNFEKSVAACGKLEKQYGLVNAKEAGQASRRAEPEKLKKARDVGKLYAQDSISRHWPQVATPQELLAAMKRDGINSKATYDDDGKLQRVVFDYQGNHYKGSELGRQYSGNNLEKNLDAQRERVLAQREAVRAAARQVGQSGTGLKALFGAVGAQAKAVEKAALDVLAQQEAAKEAARKAQVARATEAAPEAKAAQPEEKAEKSAKARGQAPAIPQRNDEIEMD